MTDAINSSISDDRKQCSITQDDKYCAVSYKDGATVDLFFTDRSTSIEADNINYGIGSKEMTRSFRGEMISYKPPVYGGYFCSIGNYDYNSYLIRHYDNLHVFIQPSIYSNSIWDEMRSVQAADGITMDDPTYTWTLHKRLDMSGWNPPYKSWIGNSFTFTSAKYPNADTYLFYNNPYNTEYRMLLAKRGDIDGNWSAGVVQWVVASSYDRWNYEYGGIICRATNTGEYALFAYGNKMEGGGTPYLLVAPPGYVLFISYAAGAVYDIDAVVAGDNTYHILVKGWGTTAVYHVMFIEGYSGGGFTTPENIGTFSVLPSLIVDPSSNTDVYMRQGAGGSRHLYKKWTGTGVPGVGNWDASWTDCRADSGYTSKTISTWAVDQCGRLYAFVFENADPNWHMHCFWLDDDGVWKATYDSVRLCSIPKASNVIEDRWFQVNRSYYPRRNMPYSGYCMTTVHGQKTAWMLYGSPQRSVDGSIPPVLYQWTSPDSEGNL